MSRGSYRISWKPAATRQLARIPAKMVPVVVEFVYSALADNPTGVGHQLSGDLSPSYAARRGDFRVVYNIDTVTGVVNIEGVGHRSDVYRRRG